MKLTNKQIVESHGPLSSLANTKLPSDTAFLVLKAIRKFNSAHEDYVKSEKKIADEYVLKNDDGMFVVENGNPVFIDKKKFDEELATLQKLESDFEQEKKIPAKMLVNAMIEPAALMMLDWLIEE